MKFCLLLIYLLLCQLGQTQPGGFVNSYPLGEKQQLPGSNWSDFNQCPDGSMLVSATGYPYQHLHSTYTSAIRFGVSLSSINTNQIVGMGGNGTWFFETSGKLVQRQGDSLILYNGNASYYSCLTVKDGIILTPKPATVMLPQYFDGNIMYNIEIPKTVVRLPTDTIAVVRDAYTAKAVLCFQQQNGNTAMYVFNEADKSLQYLCTYPTLISFGVINTFGADSAFVYQPIRGKSIINGRSNQFKTSFFEIGLLGAMPGVQLLKSKGAVYLRDMPKTGNKLLPININDRVQCLFADKYYNSYYVGGATGFQRVFPHIIQYPRLYNGNNSNANHSLVQTADGSIYVGSYNAALAKITKQGIQDIPTTFSFLPGGIGIGNTACFFTENTSSIIRVNSNGTIKTVHNKTGFYSTFSRDSLFVYEGYAGDSSFGILPVNKVFDGMQYRKKVGARQGVKFLNILTLCEDKQGRIWFGRHSQGWGVYYPKTDTAICFAIQNKETSFGAISSYCDYKGTVWLGGNHGLWYVNANKESDIAANDAFRFEHPLLPDGKLISSVKQWGSYLVLGTGRDVLLLDLKAFYKNEKKQIVRYLNPQEINLTADCEQNTMLIDNRDSSLWVATGNNVYNIDMKTWLAQPIYKAEPTINITSKSDSIIATSGVISQFEPTQNSFQIRVVYQTKDNMPRYLQYAFVAEGDTVNWGEVSLKHQFDAYNLRSGNYTFLVRIFQQDGTMDIYSFPITIKKFLWQQWWFWALIAFGIIGIVVYLFDLKRQKQIAEQQALRISAEAEALKSEQNRQLTKMQVVSLSNQFRPHFILNALNTVGAQLYDKPEVDAVLGQLGDSIGIIFKNAQAGSIAHPLGEEWKLVESVINIKQMEYNHGVMVNAVLNGKEITMQELCGNTESSNENQLRLCDTPVPMGIIQIPVENALIHGLRNKETGSQNLFIKVSNEESFLKITVTDTGIGRKAAALISNYRKNGVGTKNLMAVIELLNQYNTEKMRFYFEDDVFETNEEKHGTRVIIHIPKTFNYEIG